MNSHSKSTACISLKKSVFCVILACILLPSCEHFGKPIPKLTPKEPEKEKTKDPVATPVTPGEITRIPLGDLYQLIQSKAVLIYDVRPLLYYKLGHIPNAISFPKSNFEKDIEKHEPQITKAIKNRTPVVLYCTDLACPDALTVASQLAERGHDVSVLQGGYEAWKAAAPTDPSLF